MRVARISPLGEARTVLPETPVDPGGRTLGPWPPCEPGPLLSSSSRSRCSQEHAAPRRRLPRPPDRRAIVDKIVAIPNGRLHLHCRGEGAPLRCSSPASTTTAATGARSHRPWPNRPGSAGTHGSAPVRATRLRDRRRSPHRHATSMPCCGRPRNPGPIVVVGHSYGGAEAVTFAARFPESVRGVVLIDASPPGWNRGLVRRARRRHRSRG